MSGQVFLVVGRNAVEAHEVCSARRVLRLQPSADCRMP